MDFDAHLRSRNQFPSGSDGNINHPSSSRLSFEDWMPPLIDVSPSSRSSFGNLSKEQQQQPSFPSNGMAYNTDKANMGIDDSRAPAKPISQTVPDWSLQHRGQQQQQHISPSPVRQPRSQANEFAACSLLEHGQVQKKPRFDSVEDDPLLRKMIQKLLEMENAKLQSKGKNQVLNQVEKETVPPMKCYPKQVPDLLVSQMPLVNVVACADRITQYLQCIRHRPIQNNIDYWRKFVLEFFSYSAKKRWCLSKYADAGYHSHSVFSHVSADSWNCGVCGAKAGRGFEASFESLPRLYKVNFEGGTIDELLHLECPRSMKLPSGGMILQYANAVQKTIYKNSQISHQGQLRVTFTKDLKIISWEFCVHRHEEFVPSQLIAPQMNQLAQATKRFESNLHQNKSNGDIMPSLRATQNKFVEAGQQMTKALDSEPIGDFGFTKPLVRTLQLTEAVNHMGDLISYSIENRLGPIDSLKKLAQDAKLRSENTNERVQPMTNIQSFNHRVSWREPPPPLTGEFTTRPPNSTETLSKLSFNSGQEHPRMSTSISSMATRVGPPLPPRFPQGWKEETQKKRKIPARKTVKPASSAQVQAFDMLNNASNQV